MVPRITTTTKKAYIFDEIITTTKSLWRAAYKICPNCFLSTSTLLPITVFHMGLTCSFLPLQDYSCHPPLSYWMPFFIFSLFQFFPSFKAQFKFPSHQASIILQLSLLYFLWSPQCILCFCLWVLIDSCFKHLRVPCASQVPTEIIISPQAKFSLPSFVSPQQWRHTISSR